MNTGNTGLSGGDGREDDGFGEKGVERLRRQGIMQFDK
jgi:hypothetical protein